MKAVKFNLFLRIFNSIIMETTLLQSSMYTIGDTIGYYSALALTILMVILIVWVMYKYLDTSDLH